MFFKRINFNTTLAGQVDFCNNTFEKKGHERKPDGAMS